MSKNVELGAVANRCSLVSRVLSGLVLAVAGFVSIPAVADSGQLTTIYSFMGGISGPDAGNPGSGVILGKDGNYYGTTVYGGGVGAGTVFKLSPVEVETVLLSFDGTHGAAPSGLIQGSDGNLYGTTYWGGPNNGYGTVYKVTPRGVQTVLYNFTNGGTAGTNPTGGLVEGSDGNYYGTTSGGGPGLGGTLFKITSTGTLTVMHAFGSGDGSAPGQLIIGKDGNFYGTTTGGFFGNGTVFRMTPDGTFNVLYSFKGSPDGASPAGPLLQASDGNFYGITAGGGTGNCAPTLTTNCGTVFKLTPTGQETVLHSFAGSPDDGMASCILCTFSSEGLTEGPNGNIYGVTMAGGSYTGGNCGSGCGTLFVITPDGTETVLQSIVGVWDGSGDGWAPTGALLQTSPGVFVGTMFYGVSGWGSVYQFTAPQAVTPPTVSISAAPSSIALGQSTTLTWSSTDANACTASGAWSGDEATSGSATATPPATGGSTYVLTCSGPGGTASTSTSVTVKMPAPTVTIEALPKHVAPGQTVQLYWRSEDAVTCRAEGAWYGPEPLAGVATVTPPVSGLNRYSLKCRGTGGVTTALTVVNVG